MIKGINISQIDTLFVNGNYPIEFLFFFKNKIKTAAIRKSLKRLSSIFWPLFGEYQDGRIQFSKFSEHNFLSEFHYYEDFNEAYSEMELWEKYYQINPPKMDGLFFLSILQFNNGTVIIPKMNHLAGDGYSYFYFLAVLAAISKSSSIPFKKYMIQRLSLPNLNRTLLKEYQFIKTDIKEPDEHQNCTIGIERVEKTLIKQEIRKIQKENNLTVTANDILAMMVYKRISEQLRLKSDRKFTLSIPMDVRRQVKKLGPKFFGNGLMFHHLTMPVSELKKTDISQLALKLRESLPSVNTENYVQYLKDLELKIKESPIHSLKPYNPVTGCLVTNLSRMPVHKLNFGSGNPDFVFLLTIGRNSTAILADEDDYLLRLVY